MFKRYITKAIFTAMALGGIALLVGCGGLSQRPLAPGTTALQGSGGKVSSSGSPFILAFSDPSKARARASKPTVARGTSGSFSPRKGGELEVELDDGNGDNNGVHVQKATFEVQKGSIDHEVNISMTVYSGSALADIGVAFTPSGLRFHPSAKLTLELAGEVSKEDLQNLKAYHIEGSKVTEISIHISGGKKKLTITIDVPGFSIYSLGDELIPQAGL